MADLILTVERIETAIKLLTKEGQRSDKLIQAKAEAMAEYDKTLAVVIIKLKADGNAVSIIDKLAKGGVSDLLLKKIVAEEMLKAHYSRMEQLKKFIPGLLKDKSKSVCIAAAKAVFQWQMAGRAG